MEIVKIPSYAAVLEELKIKIRQAQQKAALSVNKELSPPDRKQIIPKTEGGFEGD